MSAPSNQVQINGGPPVSGDNLNTYIQYQNTVAGLRSFIGTDTMVVYIQGTAVAGDGGQGFFYWNATGVAADDNGATTVVPTGSAPGSGEWTRLPFSAIGNLILTGNLTVGGNTALAGTLSASGATSLAGLTVSGNETVAGTLGVTGATSLTSLTASGAATVSGQLIGGGTTTNDNAATGGIGEFITSLLSAGSAISLTTSVAVNVTSISLTAGDWDVWGAVAFQPTASTNIGFLGAQTTTSSASFGGAPDYAALSLNAVATTTITFSMPTPILRFSLATTTTVYLVADATFTASTLTAYGRISARRAR